MNKIKIVQKGNEVLNKTAKEVKLGDIKTPRIQKIIKQMSDALKEAENGVGIAAPQIGIELRIFLVSEEIFLDEKELANLKEIKGRRERTWKPLVFINAKITKTSSKKKFMTEGCLSVDGVYGDVKRAEKISFEAYNEKGEKIKRGASGIFAQVIQHEIDHLNGMLFYEKATGLHSLKT